jgi:hypothetical protein
MSYNGQYETVIDIKITCKTHEECLLISKKIKKQCEAWSILGVDYRESKSAPKGDVLTRWFTIQQTDYAHEIVIFREAINCLIGFDLFEKKVTLNVRSTTPVNIPLVTPIF